MSDINNDLIDITSDDIIKTKSIKIKKDIDSDSEEEKNKKN